MVHIQFFSKEPVANDGVHEEEEDHKSHEAETEGHQSGECVDDLLHRHPVPSVFEDLDEFDAPAGIDDGTEVVATQHRDQYQVQKVQNVQLHILVTQ
jgi:hypothetical protein